MNRVEQHLLHKLNERREAGNFRELSTDRAPVDFYSNDYLGLATNGVLAEMMLQSQAAMGTGATGSRLLSGNNLMAEELESTIADFHRAEAAVLFNSGYDANIGLLSAIAERSTTILYDELCHASIIDGVRLSQCRHRYKFRHNDPDDLKSKINKYAGEGPVIVVAESVYSMDGDMAPLSSIVSVCEESGAQLVVDEAHATGVFGAHGEGLVCALGLQDKVFARVHTFGKALGCHGAAIVGSMVLKQFLVNFARSFIYTTALPPHSLTAITCAYTYLGSPGFSNSPLHELIEYFRHKAEGVSSLKWNNSSTAIQALVIGENEKCKRMATELQRAGMQVNPILHPTVSLGKERLRVCLHSFNTRQQIDRLFELIKP